MASRTEIDFWRALASRLRQDQDVFLALVAENTRHSPGTAGARMFVTAAGETVGTIGGGIMEHDLIAEATRKLRQGEFFAELKTLHHSKSAAGERSGMICAGSQTNLYTLCRTDVDAAAVEKLISLLDEARSGTLTITSRDLTVAEEEPDLTRPWRGLERDGDEWRYSEQLLNRRRIAVLGGGHCSLALTRVMAPLGYDVLVFEASKKEPEPGLGAVARRLEIVPDFRQAGPRITFPELTWVVVMTSDFPSDVQALSGVLPLPFPFIGVMGSPAKLVEIFRRLSEDGFERRELARLRAPVGLQIGSHTPEEIAISVAAQILKERHGEPDADP